MKGHIRERSPGHWAIVIDVRELANRQTQTQVVFIFGDKEGSAGRMRSPHHGNEKRHLCRCDTRNGRRLP